MMVLRSAMGNFMLTVTQLARKCSISRATVLYYEREGLLTPARRSDNGYRWYGAKELERLQAIVSYRSYGIPVANIGHLLDRDSGMSQSRILKDHFDELEREIALLRKQQKAIVALLQEPELLEKNMVKKDRWVAIMKASGFDEAAMRTWHQKFEEMEPEEHQKFLESLGIGAAEIQKIRSL